jgi:hypothetical protein
LPIGLAGETGSATYTINTTGTPTWNATCQSSSTLPDGILFNTSANGEGLLSWPATLTAGSNYPITIKCTTPSVKEITKKIVLQIWAEEGEQEITGKNRPWGWADEPGATLYTTNASDSATPTWTVNGSDEGPLPDGIKCFMINDECQISWGNKDSYQTPGNYDIYIKCTAQKYKDATKHIVLTIFDS